MPTILVLVVLGIFAGVSPAWSQANLRPDPVPRVPPQAGQGLPLEDVEFLKAAITESRAEIDLAKLGAKAQSAEIKEISNRIGETHQGLVGQLEALAKERQVDLSKADADVPDQGGPGGAASAVTAEQHVAGRGKQALSRLSRMSGEGFGAAYVQEQIAVHDRLADLYQTQASNTPDTKLATFAIEALVDIQRDRDALRRVAGQFGIAVEQEGQPPQYGDVERGQK